MNIYRFKYVFLSSEGFGGGMLDCVTAWQSVHIGWRS